MKPSKNIAIDIDYYEKNIATEIGYYEKKGNQATLIKSGNKEKKMFPFYDPWKCQRMYMFSGDIKGNAK